ncbi:MAG: 3-deoxy-D-manno-octulosonic acid transferase, partial [bacterium]
MSVFQLFLWWGYNLVSVGLLPVALVYFWATKPAYRDPSYVRRRLGFYLPGAGGSFRTWIHAVSVGEVRACAPLIRALRAAYPSDPLLVTTATRTGMDTLKSMFPDITAEFCPVDVLSSVISFLNHYSARNLILVETEFWPNLMLLARRRGTKIFLVNGRVSDQTNAAKGIWKSLLQGLFTQVDLFLMRGEEDYRRLERLGADPIRIHVVGDMKYEVSFDGVEESASALATVFPALTSSPVVTAGSTHAGEEEAVLQAFGAVLEDFPQCILMLAPRHPDRGSEVAALLDRFALSGVRRSRLANGDSLALNARVLVLDTIGELMGAYALSFACFVGGSLVPRGGHNPIEPAAVRKPVLFGPFYQNFREASDRLLCEGGALLVDGAEELGNTLKSLLRDPPEAARMG